MADIAYMPSGRAIRPCSYTSAIAVTKATSHGASAGSWTGGPIIVVGEDLATGSKTPPDVARPARCSAGTIATIAIHTVSATAVHGK